MQFARPWAGRLSSPGLQELPVCGESGAGAWDTVCNVLGPVRGGSMRKNVDSRARLPRSNPCPPLISLLHASVPSSVKGS